MTHPVSRISGRRHATQAYATVGLQTQILGASPAHLITLLFDGAQAAIARARIHMQQGDIPGRGNAISKAIDIVDCGLKASVDLDAGGRLAENLVTVYDHVIRHLLLANLNADPEHLDLAERLLADISSAWRTVVDAPNHATATAPPQGSET